MRPYNPQPIGHRDIDERVLQSRAMPERCKRIRLAGENYLGGRACFVTLCCHDRAQLFLDSRRAARIVSLLENVSAQMSFWVHAYCAMPDHLHLLLEGREPACDVVRFVQRFKSQSAFEEKKKSGKRLWQRSFYDHILRPRDSYEGVAWYIWLNPVRKGLVAAPEEYPFSGSFSCEWKRKSRPEAAWIPPWKLPADEQLL